MVYVYIIRVRIEGFVVPDVVPKMAAMTDELVRELIAGYKPMGGLGCGEVSLAVDGWWARRCRNSGRPYTQKSYSQMI